MSNAYDLWHAELAKPTPAADRQQRSTDPKLMSGFWRIEGARTKASYPVAIWTREGEEATIFAIGAEKRPRNTVEHAAEWDEFVGGSWLNCIAVTKADWAFACETKAWPDGKPTKLLTEEQKLHRAADIIPDTPASEGGNAGAEQTYDQMINAKMQVQIEAHKKLGKIDSAEKATAAAAILEAIRALGKLGNARREEDRAPHLAAAQAVQNLWKPILEPGSELVPVIVKEIADYAKAEQARLQAIKDEEARVERKRLQAIADAEAEQRRQQLQKEADERAAAENERLAKEAAEKGEKPAAVAVPETVVVEAEEVVVEAEQVAAPKVSTTFGRAVSKAKVTKGRIVDKAAFIAAIDGQADFNEWLADKANRLARAKVALAGMEIYTE